MKKHTSFRMILGVYVVIPFGLKNAGAIYQRVINAIFHEHIRKTIEFYIDDIAMKSRDKGDHLVESVGNHVGSPVENEPD